MNLHRLKTEFYSLVAPDLPNDWDVEEAVEKLVQLDESRCRSVLDQVQVIWPVSHSLCFDYIKMAASALDCIELNSLSEWVNRTLDQYEQKGLRAAQRYMADVEDNFLCTLRGETGLRFEKAERKLTAYLRGLGGRRLDLVPSEKVWTDTSVVYVPKEITRSHNEADNFFLFKLITTYQWSFVSSATFTVSPGHRENPAGEDDSRLWLQEFLNSFTDPVLVRDLYHFLETVRISAVLEKELPGLMRRKREISADADILLLPEIQENSMLARLQRLWLSGFRVPTAAELHPFARLIKKHDRDACCAMDSVAAARKLYDMIKRTESVYHPAAPVLFQGTMDLEAVRKTRSQRLEETGQRFVEALATRIIQPRTGRLREENKEAAAPAEARDGGGVEEQGVALVFNADGKQKNGRSEKTLVLTVNNESFEPGSELEQAAADIIHELGYLPEKYVSSAVGRAGSGYAPFNSREEESGQEMAAPVTYDEWDYRRGDFRKNWCSLREMEIPLTRTSFLTQTLDRYHGQIIRLRYQFEMMRNRERFVRRQRDGEDIDLDAVIESLADKRAGLAPSDRLFIRLRRDERDIAVLFLVDMSNSTQGWVGRVIKESLVLMCEALEVVGDRYAIYGFSGMRRLRSEFFHIKHLDEPYDDAVKERIGSIAPREYTRMGPAIRHAASLLQDVDSRVRLLITLSDGKPEDYDDYKGEYAIEDTRHALIEAKLADIHPFCITIDRHARDYIEHMYGDVNYIRIDDTGRLPLKMPEIYRILTH